MLFSGTCRACSGFMFWVVGDSLFRISREIAAATIVSMVATTTMVGNGTFMLRKYGAR